MRPQQLNIRTWMMWKSKAIPGRLDFTVSEELLGVQRVSRRGAADVLAEVRSGRALKATQKHLNSISLARGVSELWGVGELVRKGRPGGREGSKNLLPHPGKPQAEPSQVGIE